MAEATPQSIEVPVPLQLFGGLVTEMSPSDLPEGISPDNQDIVYTPGAVGSRPGTAALIPVNTFPTNSTVTYQKTFVAPDGTKRNLYLTSDGSLWVQQLVGGIVTTTLLASVSPGSYADSITAFGKELIVFHNNLFGTDIPRIFDGTYLDRATMCGPGTAPTATNQIIGGPVVISDINSNTPGKVIVTTAAAHDLQVGFLAQIAGVPAVLGYGSSINSIHIDNEDNPGVATITTSTPHSLLPENNITLSGVPPTAFGSGISNVWRSGQVSTVEMNAAHGLVPGAIVLVGCIAPANFSFNGQFVVQSTPTPTQFTYVQVDLDEPVTADTGTVVLVWPILSPDSQNPFSNLFRVLEVPSPTSFTIPINYCDGTWVGGTIGFSYNGTFFVSEIISSTEFAYIQYGPLGDTSGGTATPTGQAAPGIHQAVVLFQFRSGLISKPSPATTFVANGGQYIQITNLPIGPPETVARILAFTGADGENFFYIPNPAQVNGQTVSTSTVINDNSTTSLTVDFSDNTLFSSLAIDVQGNNLFELGVLGPCLGVSAYTSRAAWKGMKNSVPNFQNLGFDGGYIGALTAPTGWTVETAGGILDSTDTGYGFGWKITGTGGISDGRISQPAAIDTFGVSILQGNTQYTVQSKLKLLATAGGTAGDYTVELYDPATATVLSSALVPIANLSSNGVFYPVNFTVATPLLIPGHLLLRVYTNGMGIGTVLLIDDIELYPTENPSTREYWWSYINLPDSLDLETGTLGSSADPTDLQCDFTYRDAFLFLTQFGLYETRAQAGSEPGDWEVNEVSRNCGACGPRACTTGENFSCWVTSPTTQPPVGRGLYLYTGGAVYKLSQEIQPDFDSVNPAYQQSIWAVNDSVTRRVYLGLPQGSAQSPNMIYVLDYREMNTAIEIAEKGPIHISFSGKMICSDLSRKWTRWNLAAQCAQIMSTFSSGVQFSIGAGNGEVPGSGFGFANTYWFNPANLTDDDYGQITPYYVTYFFVNHELEQALQVGAHRKLYKRYAIFISGVGQYTLTPYGDSLTNPWPAPPSQTMTINPTFDMGDGLNTIAERCAFKISSSPVSGSDNSFNLTKLIITMAQEPVGAIRFGAV